MIRISNIKIYENISDNDILNLVISKYKISKNDIKEWHISKKSVDARKKNDVHFSYSIDISLKDENKLLKYKNISKVINSEYPKFEINLNKSIHPIIIGSGPSRIILCFNFYTKWLFSNYNRTRAKDRRKEKNC